MNRKLLNLFFKGKATLEEEKKIRKWITNSKENQDIYNEERLLHDALIFHSTKDFKYQQQSTSKFWWIFSTSAAVVLLLIVSTIFLAYMKNDSTQYNTVIVPPGQRINLILSDNTNMWLNANSKFRYPTKFAKKDRTVYLDGEAYFEVSKNEEKPFIVKTNQGDINVTGTAFNVEAYSKLGSFNTSLFEGGVDIYINEKKHLSLHPNEKSIFKNNQLYVTNITDEDDYLWRHCLIAFKNRELKDIFLTLEKYFAVEIKIDTDELPLNTYTGKFRQAD